MHLGEDENEYWERNNPRYTRIPARGERRRWDEKSFGGARKGILGAEKPKPPRHFQRGGRGDGVDIHSGGDETAHRERKNPSCPHIPSDGGGGGGRAKVSSESRKVPESTMLCLSMSVHIAQITPADESWVSGSTKY